MRIAVVLAMLLAACAFPGFDPDPVPPEAQPQPVGPATEIGRGESAGGPWRYSVYESDMGECTRLETADVGLGESCGGSVGPGIEAMSLSSVASSTGAPSVVEGFASDDVTAVWVETDAGRVAATLMSLAPAGREGQAFVAFVPEARRMHDVVATDAGGQEVGRSSIDAP
jgi:hypothetical protein